MYTLLILYMSLKFTENFKINESVESEQLILTVQGTKCIEKCSTLRNN